jgi:hypothetical protein
MDLRLCKQKLTSCSLSPSQHDTHMFSMRMVMCSVPLPLTMKESAVSPSSTVIARFLSSSRYNRSRRFLLVTNLPCRHNARQQSRVCSVA